jgi:two-component system cell cycle response regulator
MARIVIIEDNPANLELMCYLLNAFGHSVIAAKDGSEGLDAVRRESPELIVCDVQLPKIDGYEIARRLKADPTLKGIPLIAVSALAMVGDREKGLRAGFDGYIHKPIEPESFVQELERFLHAERRGETPAPALPVPSSGGTKKPSGLGTVLVVDDTPVNLDLFRGMLEPQGYEVWQAGSVEEGLTLLATATPDLIVSDLEMPGADGFALLRGIKAMDRLRAVPFILISSSIAGERDRAMALQLGAARFVLRPLEPQLLLDDIAACLAERHA